MRVTNRMLMNNSLYNISNNKKKVDDLFIQLASEKKIQRPSDAPIIAIRALRYRSTLAEIDQYLEKNIPDADSWLACTDDAMSNISGLLGDITEYCNQAVNGYYDEVNKNTIVDNLKSFRDQIYNDANADCAGRTIFTGYKTDATLTFVLDSEKKYEITQEFGPDDFTNLTKIYNDLDVSSYNAVNLGSVDVDSVAVPETTTSHRIRLAYEGLKAEDGLTITATNPDATFTTVVKESKAGDAYMPGADEVYYLADTGELIFGDNVYNTLTLTESFKFTYTREGFEAGELDPTQYFDCVDVTDPNNTITYTNRNQEIYYEVNFNQMLKINTQGKDVFTQDMTRDLDDIVVAVNQVITIQDKMDSLEALYDTTAVDSPERENVQRLINLCQRELDFGVENMTNAFSRGITLFQKHQDVVNLARADAGARHARLQLNEERLSAQRTTVENLKSTNEDADITEVTVELTEAKSIFDASLNAAAQVVQKKLLDFL